jgi:hypothetical protein
MINMRYKIYKTKLIVDYIVTKGMTTTTEDFVNTITKDGDLYSLIAWKILQREYGPKTADRHCNRFAEVVLKQFPYEGFTLTSGQVDYYLRNIEYKPYLKKTYGKNGQAELKVVDS